MLKMNSLVRVPVSPLRSILGHSSGSNRCKHCSAYETLPHVLGICLKGELLLIKRHDTVRTLLATALRSKGLEVFEEVQCSLYPMTTVSDGLLSLPSTEVNSMQKLRIQQSFRNFQWETKRWRQRKEKHIWAHNYIVVRKIWPKNN